MPNTPNTSFIPKRGPANRTRRAASRKIYIFTVLSYVLLFTSLIATAGIYFYQQVVDKQLADAVVKLNSSIAGFNQADLETVKYFDIRVQQAQKRVDAAVALSSVFSALEAATVRTAQIDDLIITRNQDKDFELAATITTDGFDSSLFQRSIFRGNSVIESVEITDLQFIEANDETGDGTKITLSARLGVPLENVPYEPTMNVPSTPAVSVPEVFEDLLPVDEGVEVSNENNI